MSCATAGLLRAGDAPEPGLLFYLSGEHGTTADFSRGGTPTPTFDYEVEQIPDGAKGAALSCGNLQRLAWKAPGNIYAQRGTLSFYWRAREPVGPTPFPVFRVGYAEHSSWDMVFLRIDYNGHGFDAFVTDASLARTRVSVTLDPFPAPNQWIHLVLGWDETKGIRFYIDGKVAAAKEAKAVYNAALDQFGPHSRIISPHNVQSDYNFVRGGDIDEVRIYDRMVTDDEAATLAKGEGLALAVGPDRPFSASEWSDEWALRYGWNRTDALPPYYAGDEVSVRKVEIHDAYDLKRWWWKACDGIRETTWPGVYNRSRLPGRNDYFQLPDWDCYSLSGKSITFFLPEEPWNHIEISGAAWGKVSMVDGPGLFDRPENQERTVNTVEKHVGGKVRFDNVMQEEPIGEFGAYYVANVQPPAADHPVELTLSESASGAPSVQALEKFIVGRFPQDERSELVATASPAGPAGSSGTQVTLSNPSGGGAPQAAGGSPAIGARMPIVHLIVPAEVVDSVEGGLDGVVIELPALKVTPYANGLFPINVQVKDSLWNLRDLCDFTFSVKPGEAKTLWLDTRDRLLPKGKGLYLTIAGAGADFGPESLAGAKLRLLFKPKPAALAEHSLDRFTQLRDEYAMLVEEHPYGSKFDLWNRFELDLRDMLKNNPNYPQIQNYAAVALRDYPAPPYTQPTPPQGVPLWAFRQVESLRRATRFANWWIDHRQVENGEYGGGLSDDTDLTNTWPGIALMGSDPAKIGLALQKEVDACYRQGMIVNGLCAIQADELHSYEEGNNCLGQNLILNYASPRMLERAMETARGFEWLTGVNAAGHRHIMSSYFNGQKMATDSVWGYAKAYSYLIMQPGQLLVDFNGNPRAKRIALEVADGLLAHRRKDEDGAYGLPSAIHFVDDKDSSSTRAYFPWPLFWSSYKWTGDKKYLLPIFDGGTTSIMGVNANLLDLADIRGTWGKRMLGGERGRRVETRVADGRGAPVQHADRTSNADFFRWQLTGDKGYLERLYGAEIAQMDLEQYINTEGSLWIDRVNVPHTELQRSRLGGVALVRNGTFPGHVVSWTFDAPEKQYRVAILVPSSTTRSFKIIAYNLDQAPVHAVMRGWNVDPGQWDVQQGSDSVGDDVAHGDVQSRTVSFGRTQDLDLTFPPRTTTILTCTLKAAGTPYWQRPDLGIDPEDVQLHGREVRVTVHSLGSVPTPPAKLVLRGADGAIVATELIPAIAAPTDLYPRTCNVRMTLPASFSPAGAHVEIDPDGQVEQITRVNDSAPLPPE